MFFTGVLLLLRFIKIILFVHSLALYSVIHNIKLISEDIRGWVFYRMYAFIQLENAETNKFAKKYCTSKNLKQYSEA